MKKFSYIILVFLLAISFTFAFSGCKQTSETPTEYGKVKILGGIELKYDAAGQNALYERYRKGREDEAAVMLSSFDLQFFGTKEGTIADVRCVKDADSIVYVTENHDLENAVVTDKWTYFFSVLRAKGGRDENAAHVNVSSDFIETLYADEYCMEKMCFDWLSHRIDVERSPYYGKTWREAEAEYGKTVMDLAFSYFVQGAGEDPVFDDMRAREIGAEYKMALRTAALYRYGILRDEMFTGVGTLSVTFVANEWDDNGVYRSDATRFDLNVVGYVETEADKLLSTGVSMDKNSDEYKIVMEQLKNPVFYSVCGNFLDEVEK